MNEAAYKVIVPNITNENKISGNYEFKFIEEDDYKGDLKVTKQTLNKEDLLKKIDLKGTTNGIYGVKNGADELEKSLGKHRRKKMNSARKREPLC